MELKFDANQSFQLDAIASTVNLFGGQPRDVSSFLKTLEGNGPDDQTSLFANEIGAVGNNLVLDDITVLENLRTVQEASGLEPSSSLKDGLNFDTEMETGTGKTYVYLRTIFELATRYSFTKFIILVPSVAIKEGVDTSIRLMRKHFMDLYSRPFDVSVYTGKRPEEVQAFATSTNVQIMVMTIDSLKGDKNTRIIHQYRDKLNGLRPIDFLSATRPIVIMDEPQKMESDLSQSAVSELNPMCILRYSATHAKERNVVYRLDPVDAHERGLVKEIAVSEVTQQGADSTPYIKLVDVQRDPWRARLELMVRTASGIAPKTVTVKPHDDLATVTGNDGYQGNWRVNEVSLEPVYVELTQHGILRVGESIGANSDVIYKEMIRETVREHLRKELQLKDRGIKVLSLFFVDKVSNYIYYAEDGSAVEGPFAQWFDEVFVEERARLDEYSSLLPQAPHELRRAYFAEMRKAGRTTFVDSTERGNARDDEAYDLIMRDKERLLDVNEPVRFIFSHSALQEGWDNPNVFQICVLRPMSKDVERRQTIGRGLRLPVASTGERVADRAVAQLTVVANESYRQFAETLQTEYVKAGVSIGVVRKNEFARLLLQDGSEETFGYARSEAVWNHLRKAGFIDDEGRVLGTFVPNQEGFTLDLPDEYRDYENPILDVIEQCRVERFIKQKKKRTPRTFNKELVLTPEFEEFWNKISRRTTYRVAVKRDEVITRAVNAIRAEDPIPPIRIQVSSARIRMLRGGARTDEMRSPRVTEIDAPFALPDIIKELQEATSLTRHTIVDILVASGRLAEFAHNPNDFIEMAKRNILAVLSQSIIEGIQYEELDGSVYELRELQEDGMSERDRFVDQLYEVKNKSKTDFDYVVYDSAVERQFAKMLDDNEDIKLFMKLPLRFTIPTPVGPYNPDWAIIKQVDGREKAYMIRETKSTSQDAKLRATEVAKIKCGAEHFATIGVEDFSLSSPGSWNL